jgi:hypothetical protein
VYPGGDEAFEEGVFNVHHGPLMLFAGVLGRIDAPAYRDLPYCYGSYVLSLRWIRPTRLQFWLEPDGEEATRVRLRVDSVTRGWIAGIWTFVQGLFWRSFPHWIGRESRRLVKRGLAG